MSKKDFLKKINRDSYRLIAADFSQTRQARWPEFEDLTKDLSEGQAVLDLGCGNGRLLKALPKVNFKYLGIDSNDELLQKAQQDFPNRDFQKASMPDINLGQDIYDIVFIIAAFHHLIDKKERLLLLEKVYQSLKSGGQLRMTNWKLWQKKYFKFFFKWWFRKISWNDFFIPWKNQPDKWVWRYYHGFTAGELKRLLKQAGFKNIKQKKSSHNYITTAQK